jgi:Protein of unknown function (DUF2889)
VESPSAPTEDYPLPPLLLPPDDDQLIPLHTRSYEVEVYRASATEMVVRGAVRDLKPGLLYIADDPDPMPMHHMVVELRVGFPELTIESATVEFQIYPEDDCPSIRAHYAQLVGLSIARGFTHKVRELFGGPRGCTHTTALLQAMAPAVVQATFSMQIVAFRDLPPERRLPRSALREMGPEERRKFFRHNLNSCHVWEEHGEVVARLERGDPPRVPVFIRQRFAERGRDLQGWRGPTA